MGFFDFFGTAAKTVDEAAKKGKPRRPGLAPGVTEEQAANYQLESDRRAGMTDDQLLGEASQRNEAFKASQRPGVIPEAKAIALEKRNKLESDAKNKAIALLKEALKTGQFYGRDAKGIQKEYEEQYVSPIYRSGIGSISRVTRASLKQLGNVTAEFQRVLEPRIQEIEALESIALKAQDEAPGIPYQPGSGKLEAASQRAGEIEEALKYTVTPEQQKQLQSERARQMGILDPGGRIMEAQREANALTPPSETIKGAADAAGVPENDFNDGIAEIAKKMGVNLDAPVEFPLALQRLLNTPDFADVRPDFEAIGAQAQPQPQVGATAGAQQGTGAEAGAQPQQPTDLYGEEKQLLARLAQTKDINTWYEAIAFVLLSMLIKPQMAILFFSRQSERGQLKAELQEKRRMISLRENEKKSAREQAEWDRQEAAKSRNRMREDVLGAGLKSMEEEKGFRRQWFLLSRRLAAMKKDTTDPAAKAIQQDINNYLDMSAKYSAAMDHGNAKLYLKKADNAIQLLLKHKAGDEIPALDE